YSGGQLLRHSFVTVLLSFPIARPFMGVTEAVANCRAGELRYHPPRPMSFRLERDLLHVLRDYSGPLFSHATEELRVFTEIQIGMRIPDLLIVSGPAPESGRSQRLAYFDCAI